MPGRKNIAVQMLPGNDGPRALCHTIVTKAGQIVAIQRPSDAADYPGKPDCWARLEGHVAPTISATRLPDRPAAKMALPHPQHIFLTFTRASTPAGRATFHDSLGGRRVPDQRQKQCTVARSCVATAAGAGTSMALQQSSHEAMAVVAKHRGRLGGMILGKWRTDNHESLTPPKAKEAAGQAERTTDQRTQETEHREFAMAPADLKTYAHGSLARSIAAPAMARGVECRTGVANGIGRKLCHVVLRAGDVVLPF